MLQFQNNCINNGVAYGLKQKKKKAFKTALYGEIKDRRETKSEWLIGVHTQNILYLSIVTTQHSIRQRRVRRLLMRVKARINDW